MKRHFLLIFLFLILISACAVNTQSNSPFPPTLDQQLKARVESLYQWYIGRSDSMRMTAMKGDEGPAIQNKKNYIEGLRISGYFAGDFTLMLEVLFDGCEEISRDEPGTPLRCLDEDPITFKKEFDQFVEISWEETKVDSLSGTADLSFEIRGISGIEPAVQQPISVRIKAHLVREEKGWVVGYLMKL